MIEYTVNPWNNFCRIFELPKEFPTGHCFGGGHPCNFQLVDWFYPTSVNIAAVSKEVWQEKIGSIEEQNVIFKHNKLKEKLLSFLLDKNYIKDERKYLFISDFGMVFLFSKNSK